MRSRWRRRLAGGSPSRSSTRSAHGFISHAPTIMRSSGATAAGADWALAACCAAGAAGTTATANAALGDLVCTASAQVNLSPVLNGPTPVSAPAQGSFDNCTSASGSYPGLTSASLAEPNFTAHGCVLGLPAVLEGPIDITWNNGTTSPADARLSLDPGAPPLGISATIISGPMTGDTILVVPTIVGFSGLCGLGGMNWISFNLDWSSRVVRGRGRAFWWVIGSGGRCWRPIFGDKPAVTAVGRGGRCLRAGAAPPGVAGMRPECWSVYWRRDQPYAGSSSRRSNAVSSAAAHGQSSWRCSVVRLAWRVTRAATCRMR